jgi:hypothetical protein
MPSQDEFDEEKIPPDNKPPDDEFEEWCSRPIVAEKIDC